MPFMQGLKKALNPFDRENKFSPLNAPGLKQVGNAIRGSGAPGMQTLGRAIPGALGQGMMKPGIGPSVPPPQMAPDVAPQVPMEEMQPQVQPMNPQMGRIGPSQGMMGGLRNKIAMMRQRQQPPVGY
jgi:hypothetical protein